MKTLAVLPARIFLFLQGLLILVVIICSTIGCSKKDEQDPPPVYQDEIVQPANPNDPAVLPEIKTVIQKLDGDFTPLLSGTIANWRIRSHKDLGLCWSDWVDTQFLGVTREGIKGKGVYYPSCIANNGGTWTPDFSAPCGEYWGQYKKGQEIQDGDLHTTPGGTVNFYRYYTISDFPDAYIKMVRSWEVVKIEGSDYAHCQGCSSLEKTTTTKTGLSEENTVKWGYTLGLEWTGTGGIKFIEASLTLKATISQEFSTSITTEIEHTEEITCVGTLPAGKSIIRLQAFREISTFSLVDENGNPYGHGIYCPDIETTTQIKNYAWYY